MSNAEKESRKPHKEKPKESEKKESPPVTEFKPLVPISRDIKQMIIPPAICYILLWIILNNPKY